MQTYEDLSNALILKTSSINQITVQYKQPLEKETDTPPFRNLRQISKQMFLNAPPISNFAQCFSLSCFLTFLLIGKNYYVEILKREPNIQTQSKISILYLKKSYARLCRYRQDEQEWKVEQEASGVGRCFYRARWNILKHRKKNNTHDKCCTKVVKIS